MYTRSDAGASSSDQHPDIHTEPSLCEVFKSSFRIGAAVNPFTIKSSQSLLAHHYNSVTAENDMKFESLQRREGEFTFDAADEIVSFAQNHNMAVRGHTLVWHNQTPRWVFESSEGVDASATLLKDRMKQHIQTVVSHFKDSVDTWDVVNEAIEDKQDTYLRETPWRRILGDDYLQLAFEYAHESAPNAKLFYNDYNETNPTKRDKIARLVKELKEKGTPIHGIGMQGHWQLNNPPLDEIKQAIECYAALDVQIHITELDISVFEFDDRRTDLTHPTEAMMASQAERYEQIFNLFKSYKDVIQSVTFWGAADDYTWLHNFPVRGRRNWPFLFDANHQPKSSFWRVIQE